MQRLFTLSRLLLSVACCLSLAGGPGAPKAAAMGYTITDLGSLGGDFTLVGGLNNEGQVAGFSIIGSTGHPTGDAFLFDSTGMHDLNLLPSVSVQYVNGINDAGQIVGAARFGPDQYLPTHAFLYDGAPHDLTPEAQNQRSAAVAVNASGHVAGVEEGNSVGSRLPFWYDGTSVHPLGALPGYRENIPAAINASDEIVGNATTADQSRTHGIVWKNGVAQDLGTLGGTYSSAFGINDAGQIVGKSTLSNNISQHAFLYDAGGMHDLGTLGGGHSYGLAINNLGQVAGLAQTDAPLNPFDIFLYSHGVMLDVNTRLLSTPPWESVLNIPAINDRGQILVSALSAHEHAYLLTPVTAPEITRSPNRLDFGTQAVGITSEPSAVTLTNTGDAPLEITGVSLTSANSSGFVITGDTGPTTLPPGSNRVVRIAFTAPAPGAFSAVLAVNDNDHLAGSSHSITLAGSGAFPTMSLRPSDSLDFGRLPVGNSSDQPVTITNSGTVPLSIRGISVQGPNAAEFTVSGGTGAADTPPPALAPGESRTLTVRFTPPGRGSRSASLVIASSAPDSPTLLGLTGAGLAPAANISPSSLDFGPQPVGAGNDAQALTLQNTGDAPLRIERVAVEGVNPGDFAIATDGWTGAVLQPGQIATLNLRFTPTAAGSRTAQLVVTDNALDSPQRVPLAGSGAAPAASLDATALSFGDQPVGTSSAAQTVTLTNRGTAPLTVGAISFAGGNPADFTAALDPGSPALAPGESRALQVRFRPTGPGNRSATLVLSAAGGPLTVALTGSGTAPAITFGISRLTSPGSVTFGSVPLGTSSAAQTVTLTNSGTAPLTFGGIALGGGSPGDYQMVADSGEPVLPPGASRTLTLRFTPMTAGARGAVLTVTGNATAGPQSLTLSGSGVLPGSSSTGAAPLPTGAKLVVTAIDGSASPAPPLNASHAVVVSVGQTVALKLLLQFANGAAVDVSADLNCHFGTGAPVGTFTSKTVWQAGPADAGRTVVIGARYRSPASREWLAGTVTVTVKAVRRRR